VKRQGDASAGNRLKAVRNGVTTKYVYDAAGNLLAEADSSGTITQYYIHGAGLIALKPQGDGVYCYHFDATGNTVALTDQSGSIANTYAYKPFGEMTQGQTQTITQPFTYVGQYGVMAEPYGYYYMRARYYDSGSGRFVSEDPLGFGGGDVNLYAYVRGNPVGWVDPSGLWTAQIGANIGYTLPFCLSGSFFFGIAVDDCGGVAGFHGGGVGYGAGAGGSLSIGAAVSNAMTVNDLGGAFVNASIGAGIGGHVSVDSFAGPSDHGLVIGSGVSLGIGIGGGSLCWAN